MSETDNIARGNHVVPTEWAQQLERERDEARQDLEHWKSEWEIVEARLCGWKHHRDNGIIFEHEVIPRICNERDEAREELNNIRINLGEDADGFTLLHAVCALQNERDEARAVADELSAIAARYLGWHLSRTPMGPDDDHLAQSRRISEAIARWKSLASA